MKVNNKTKRRANDFISKREFGEDGKRRVAVAGSVELFNESPKNKVTP
jgi:hypothetical protein